MLFFSSSTFLLLFPGLAFTSVFQCKQMMSLWNYDELKVISTCYLHLTTDT
jgi:hypothetical protein